MWTLQRSRGPTEVWVGGDAPKTGPGDTWEPTSDLEGTCPAPGPGSSQEISLICEQGNRIWRPCRLFFFFTEQSPIFALFPSLVCKQPHCPMPHPHSCGSALPMSAEGCSPFQESNTTAHPSPLPQIPSLPRAQRKHAKHFTQRFMAVLLLLFLNRGGKGLEVFINKGFRKTRLIIQSAAWSGNCASLTQIHGTPLPACCFHTT